MLAVGLVALSTVGTLAGASAEAAGTTLASRPAPRADLTYRLGGPLPAKTVSRNTPLFDGLNAMSGTRLQGRHFEVALDPFAVSIESARTRAARDALSHLDLTMRGVQPVYWHNAKQLAFAAAVDWATDAGRFRLSAAADRMRLNDAGFSRGRTGITQLTAQAAYVAAGWTIGGGWQSTATGKKDGLVDRMSALASGAPLAGRGEYIRGTLAIDRRTTLQAEGAVVTLSPLDGTLLNGGTDRRFVLTMRHGIS